MRTHDQVVLFDSIDISLRVLGGGLHNTFLNPGWTKKVSNKS